MNRVKRLLAKYDYAFPKSAIAQTPVHPRDSARLLVYDRETKSVECVHFRDIGKYLPAHGVLVLNDTKVIPAKIIFKKSTGGKVPGLYLSHTMHQISVLLSREVPMGAKLTLGPHEFRVVGKAKNEYFLHPSFPARETMKVLLRYGEAPLPPYIKENNGSDKKVREEYQSVFARRSGSIAAPTASLHFTKALLAKLRKKGIAVKFITLHVHLGTFSPLTSEALQTGKLHRERFHIDEKTARFLEIVKREGRPIIAVGTTVTRALESAANEEGKLARLEGETDLFIREDYSFKFVDALITNFHVPRSSLLMLVSALTGRKKLLKLYKEAIKRKFRLFSFGDAMLVK